jgi:hypothetical protein
MVKIKILRNKEKADQPLPGRDAYLEAHIRQSILEHADESVNNFKIRSMARAFTAIVGTEKEAGVFTDIQEAIDAAHEAGGGKVLLLNGRFYPTSDITLYSGIYLEGQTAQSTIIDFGGQAYGIKAVGSDAYSAGTITVVNGSASVTGAGTSWTTAMIGRSILLSGIWYPILDVNAGTQTITIAAPYTDANLTTATYIIATTIDDVNLSNFTVTNSTASALKVQYGNFGNLDGIIATSSLVGIEFRDSSTYSFGISSIDGFYNHTNFIWDNCHYVTTTAAGSIATLSGNGWEISNCTNSAINDSFILASVGDGIQITNCDIVLFKGVTSKGNGGKGINLISGNNQVQFVSVNSQNNVSDGIKLTATSDNCQMSNCQLFDNGGYGINIAAANCNNNFLNWNQYSGNAAGPYKDGGTDTSISEVGTLAPTAIAGATLRASADTERNGTDLAWTKKKEIKTNVAGMIRVDFEVKMVGSSGAARIYKNGAALGTSFGIGTLNTWFKFSDYYPSEFATGYSFAIGDLIQLYALLNGAGTYYVRNFRVYFDYQTTLPTVVNTD